MGPMPLLPPLQLGASEPRTGLKSIMASKSSESASPQSRLGHGAHCEPASLQYYKGRRRPLLVFQRVASEPVEVEAKNTNSVHKVAPSPTVVRTASKYRFGSKWINTDTPLLLLLELVASKPLERKSRQKREPQSAKLVSL